MLRCSAASKEAFASWIYIPAAASAAKSLLRKPQVTSPSCHLPCAVPNILPTGTVQYSSLNITTKSQQIRHRFRWVRHIDGMPNDKPTVSHKMAFFQQETFHPIGGRTGKAIKEVEPSYPYATTNYNCRGLFTLGAIVMVGLRTEKAGQANTPPLIHGCSCP